MAHARALKFSLLGPTNAGTTSLCIVYKTAVFPDGYVPVSCDNFTKHLSVDRLDYDITFWDLYWGSDYHSHSITIGFPGTHLYLLCFSLGDRESLSEARGRFAPLIEQAVRGTCSVPDEASQLPWEIDRTGTNPPEWSLVTPDAKILVVGLKSDAKLLDGAPVCAEADIRQLVDEIGAHGYVECSALNGNSVEAVLETGVRVCVGRGGRGGGKKCHLM